MRFFTLCIFLTILSCFSRVSQLHAGGGPENVFLVVNALNENSVTVANHYLHLRQIPASNVLYLNYKPDPNGLSLEGFRKNIPGPVLQAMQVRGITSHIDIITYSTGFPVAVGFAEEAKKVSPPSVEKLPVGSITGMTYLYTLSLNNSPNAVNAVRDYSINRYFRPINGTKLVLPSHGFRSWYGWDTSGMVQESGGEKYILSTMLGVDSNPGNSVSEIISCLESSAKADYTQPKGTFYFSKFNDIRCKARELFFEEVVSSLKATGKKAEIITEQFPYQKYDVVGAQLGVPSIDLGDAKKPHMKVLGGGIVDNLTSFGARFDKGHGQPLLSDFIRVGTAGSCGTVVEPQLPMPNDPSKPYVSPKFPSPYLYYHYAQGCSLAESFYQSIRSPYQILIVGDPLCSPFAIPTVLDLQEPITEAIKGVTKITPKVTSSKDPVDRFELYIDGSSVAQCGANESMEFDPRKYADGYHELRLVGVQNNDQEFQGNKIIHTRFDNYGKKIGVQINPAKTVKTGQSLQVKVICPEAQSIVLLANGKKLGDYPGDKIEVEIATKPKIGNMALGIGPVTFSAIGVGKSGPSSHAIAPPSTIIIEQ